nr:1259_t:CDS:2 [Entrophospora candida]
MASTKHSDLVTREVFKENFDHWPKKIGERNDDDEYKKLDLEGCRVVGVDLGRGDLFIAVDQNEKSEFVVSKCSSTFYMGDLFDFYKEKHWRRLRWSNYISKQKAMDKICRRIANNELFHAPFSSSSKGHAGPVKQLMWS